MKKILMLSGIAWDATLQRHQMIATGLTKAGYEVDFIESIISSKFTIKKFFERCYNKKQNKYEHNERGNVNVLNFGFVNPQNGLFKKINKWKIQKYFKNNNRCYDFVIFYLPINTTEIILEEIKYSKLIYDCVRAFENWGGYPKNIMDIEMQLAKKSNAIIVDSYYLKNKFSNTDFNKYVYQFLPAVETNLLPILKSATIKKEINHIVYFGSISSHINTAILNDLANQGYNIHLYGDISGKYEFSNNIHINGYYSDLEEMFEQIINLADAFIIPYKGNMDGVIPAKLLQCVATGLPVYISEFYDSQRMKDLLYVYKNFDDLLIQITEFNKEKHLKKINYKDFIENNNSDAFIKNIIRVLEK